MHSWVCSTKEKYIGGLANRLYYYIYCKMVQVGIRRGQLTQSTKTCFNNSLNIRARVQHHEASPLLTIPPKVPFPTSSGV